MDSFKLAPGGLQDEQRERAPREEEDCKGSSTSNCDIPEQAREETTPGNEAKGQRSEPTVKLEVRIDSP